MNGASKVSSTGAVYPRITHPRRGCSSTSPGHHLTPAPSRPQRPASDNASVTSRPSRLNTTLRAAIVDATHPSTASPTRTVRPFTIARQPSAPRTMLVNRADNGRSGCSSTFTTGFAVAAAHAIGIANALDARAADAERPRSCAPTLTTGINPAAPAASACTGFAAATTGDAASALATGLAPLPSTKRSTPSAASAVRNTPR